MKSKLLCCMLTKEILTTKHLSHLSNQKIIENTSTGAFCIVGEYHNSTYVVFRGTQTDSFFECVKDIISDSLWFFKKIRIKDSKIHFGFVRAFGSIGSDILLCIKNKKKTSKIIVCGHSMGAAIATLFVWYCSLLRITISELYLYGSPRVGNKKFVEIFRSNFDQKNVYNFVNVFDFITYLPPKIFGYRDTAKKIYIGKKIFFRDNHIDYLNHFERR